MLTVDREVPLRFLRIAFDVDDWIAILLKSYETDVVRQRVGPVSMVANPRFQAWLRFQNARKFNVYVSVNAVKPNQRSRTRESICAVRHLFLEVDRDAEHTLGLLAKRSDLPAPSYVLHSSPNRVHIFWRVKDFPKELAEALQRQQARDLETDTAATSVAQMTRLPGFLNHKRSPASVIAVEYLAPGRIYGPTDFPKPAPVLALGESSPIRRSPSTCSTLERARRYLDAVPPAIAGCGGDAHTFRTCCRLVRGFGLNDPDALALLESWNSGCQPPWSAQELAAKLRSARKYGREPFAGRLS